MNTLLRPALYLLKGAIGSALAAFLLVPAAWGEVALYYNDTALNYYIPGNPPPQIDARGFFNDGGGVFTVSYNNDHPGTPFFETVDTLFYTNSGVMIANSPSAIFSTSLLSLFNQDFGFGFKFDLQSSTGNNYWADTFYNPGTIRGVSAIDGNNLVEGVTLFGTTFALFTSYSSLGEVLVSATNIINPGTVDVSAGGKIGFTGKNVDLSQAQLTVESPLNFFGALGTANYTATGAVGMDTNGDWNAGVDLAPTYAYSSFVPIPPYFLDLTNCQAYQDIRHPPQTNTVYRYIFVENITNSPYITYNAYLDDPNTVTLGFQPGAAHVEWIASYPDAATGNQVNNYLYLTDDYALGKNANNDPLINGVPENFSFATSTTEALLGPVSPTNALVLPPDVYSSNNYACFFANMTAATASTNVSATNPHGTITNLPGQVIILASNELNLAYASINSPNYVNINCTNQFDGSPGASIAAPYSDLSLGVTNGFLTVSNVLMAQLPNWSGAIQAWSSDWITTDPVTGATNEYKVLLVFSSLLPTTIPWSQNLYLHGTNTLAVSDALNVYGSFYSDAKVLTLQSNQLGAGATSLYGQLFWDSTAPFNANTGSGLQQMPNLLWFTNDGAFFAGSTANFGSTATPQSAFTPTGPATAAAGTLFKTSTGTNAVRGDKVTIGTNQYVFVGTLTNSRANQVKWGTTLTASLTNLIAAINGTTGAGVAYSTATKANALVKAGPLSGQSFTVTARSTGTAGNSIVTTFTPAKAGVVNLAWGGATLSGGANVAGVTVPTAFVNQSTMVDQGANIWTTYFENDGTITNGGGSFDLHTGLAVINGMQPPTNGSVVANGDILLVATNQPGLGMNGLLISNVMLQAGHKLSLICTNIYDGGVSNGNIFVVGSASGGGASDSGFNVPLMPPGGSGSLLGTTVTNIAPALKTIYNVWAGTNRGLSSAGFTNNLAIGHLVLDSLTTNLSYPPVAYVFNGVGVSNALYVDLLELKDGATQGSNTFQYNFPWLHIGNNMTIYYARAIMDLNGQSYDQSEAIDWAAQFQNANGGRLRWISSYAGYFSSTNYYFTNQAGMVFTRPENLALAQSTVIDSDADGMPNAGDPTPFFLPPEMKLTSTVTNLPPQMLKIAWTTIPNATNYVYYTTNFSMPATNWLHFTSSYWSANLTNLNAPFTNALGVGFISPQVYRDVATTDNAQQTNVWVYDAITNEPPRYYRVHVCPQLNLNDTNAP